MSSYEVRAGFVVCFGSAGLGRGASGGAPRSCSNASRVMFNVILFSSFCHGSGAAGGCSGVFGSSTAGWEGVRRSGSSWAFWRSWQLGISWRFAPSCRSWCWAVGLVAAVRGVGGGAEGRRVSEGLIHCSKDSSCSGPRR